MKPFKKVAILGDGGWGTTLALLLYENSLDVTLWSAFASYARVLDKKRVNPNFLKGVGIPRGIRITASLDEALQSDLIVLAVPSQYLRSVLLKGRAWYVSAIPVLSVVKGIEEKTLLRASDLIKEVWSPGRLAVLSGPTIASEVAHKLPAVAVAASNNRTFIRQVQELFRTPAFRVYGNSDMTGVELGGSLKNIIAIACGISDGLRFGVNAKAALLSRGLAEIARLGTAMGAKKQTFFGVSGVGDLVTTCFSPLSRNRFVGEQIGRGRSLKEVVSRMKMVAEGVSTAKAAYQLGKQHGVDMPITDEIYKVLFRNKRPITAVRNLMMRRGRLE